MNETTMYANVDAVKQLNYVEGFDPFKYMRNLASEGEAPKLYLDVAYRKLWFRLKHPNGKIVKTLMKLTDQMAVVEAKVYLDREDPADSYIANAMAQRYLTPDDQFGMKYVELAETAAVGRALKDAGFGLQFPDLEGDFDQNVVDAPYSAGNQPYDGQNQVNESGGESNSAGARQNRQRSSSPKGAVQSFPGNGVPAETAQNGGQSSPPAGASRNRSENRGSAAAMQKPAQNMPPAMNQPPVMNQPGTVPAMQSQRAGNAAGQGRTAGAAASGNTAVSAANGMPQIDKKLPVETIYGMLNRQMAEAVVCPFNGANKNKTLGTIAVEKPGTLKWIVDEYRGPDNLLRAAAAFLINTALPQAG